MDDGTKDTENLSGLARGTTEVNDSESATEFQEYTKLSNVSALKTPGLIERQKMCIVFWIFVNTRHHYIGGVLKHHL